MKKDFDKTLKAIDSTVLKIIKDKKDKKEVPLTFKDRILDSLLAFGQQQDIGMTGETKIKLYKLAVKVQDAKGLVDYTIDELKLIDDRCIIYQPTLIYGQIHELIEMSDLPDKDEDGK